MKPLLRKSNKKTNVITVDPGWNTGIASWTGQDKLPDVEIFKEPAKRKNIKSVVKRLVWMLDIFEEYIRENSYYKYIYIEGSELWTGSAVSMASGSRGDTFTLAYLIGGYINICVHYNIDVEIIPPKKWKGNLNAPKLDARLNILLGQTYPEHIREAVGLGLWVKGVL